MVEVISGGMEMLDMMAAAEERKERAPWGAPHHPRFPVFLKHQLVLLSDIDSATQLRTQP